MKNSIENSASDKADRALLEFEKFQRDVEGELTKWIHNSLGSADQRSKLLNGGANTAAFSLIKEHVRKKWGIFFSGHELANLAASKIQNLLASGASVIDPACGAGDLLIACARHYPKQLDYESTLSLWESRLAGIDLHEPFINTVKSRLKLLATEFHLPHVARKKHKEPHFPNLVIGDTLAKTEFIKQFDLVITNPPYGATPTPPSVTWSTGKVQLAAIFMDHILKNSKPGQEIVAILPDVLRSGSRYGKWREWIASKAKILSINVIGKFDKTTDVDVFLLHLRTDEKTNRKWPDVSDEFLPKRNVKLGDIFKVRVGPVVPHRDKENGAAKLYIDCSNTSRDTELIPTQYRRFCATPHKGPFVVIHRTSSPNDKTRLVASIVNTQDWVLVENHLIILQPIDGALETCRQLLVKLKDRSVTNWINQRIRCRHLTVTAIRDIPLTWGQ